MHSILLGTTILSAALISGGAFAQSEGSSNDPDAAAQRDRDQIIVTGVLRESRIEDAPVAVTALSGEELVQAAPISAADALKSVPGVFVNSAFGEIRNIVYSRGVSAFSNEAATGYFYVSMQEDGLPLSNLTSNNFGPDYYARPDAMLARIEALRGGTAAITGPNAPGGIFNYLSKNGRDNPGGLLEYKFGQEGNLSNPFHRGDFYYGGQVPGVDDLYFSVGGFYRVAEGARSAGYNMNEGGQVRANVLWDYDRGELKVTGKLLDDRNGFFEFLPARNFNDPQLVDGFEATDSWLPPRAPHTWIEPDGSTGSWDGGNLIQNEQQAITVNWKHDLDGGWEISYDGKYSNSTSDWNTGAIVVPTAVDDPALYFLANAVGLPGTFSFIDPATDETLATVVSPDGFNYDVVQGNLPASNILQNGVLSQVALDQVRQAEEFISQFKVSKSFDDHAFTLGAFYAYTDVSGSTDGAGFGVTAIENQPTFLDIRLELPGVPAPFEITSPEGFAALGDLGAAGAFDGSQEMVSLFFGHQWNVTDRLAFDWGLRYENLTYESQNTISASTYDPATIAFTLLTNPGLVSTGPDGDLLTWYENFPAEVENVLDARRTYEYLNYSLSSSYVVTDNLNVYLRYSSGRKAPDFGIVQGIDSQFQLENQFIDPQEIDQFELGVKYSTDRLNLAVYPFWSRLQNVVELQSFFDENGDAFTPDPLVGNLITMGVEIEGDFKILDTLSLRSAFTIQSSEAQDFGFYIDPIPNGPRGDEILVDIPDGPADNIPDFMGRTTLTWTPSSKFSSFFTWDYMGDRAANRQNAFTLPSYSLFNAGASYAISDSIAVRLDVKNVLNKENAILSWAAPGGISEALNRQPFTAAQIAANPDQSFPVLAAQPRAAFVTASLKF